jgi:hypothetical protein
MPLFNAKTYKALKSLDSYEPRGFYPASIDDTSYDGRYEVLYRFGYGVYSTVWLAESFHYKPCLYRRSTH